MRLHHVRLTIALVSVCAMATRSGESQVTTEAAEPEWLAELFAYTGRPGECENRLKRIAAEEMTVGDVTVGQVTCELIYRDILGQAQTGRARFFVPTELRDDREAPVALMCNAGYETDAAGAAGYVAEGWIVSTQHADPRNPLDRGPNLDVAVLHAARALAFVDNSRVMIQGGSAGGYMTLMVAAETFPVVCAVPLVPPVNVAYNAAYFVRNREVATAVPEGSDEPAMRVLTVVIPIADAAARWLGTDTDGDPWLYSSPIAHLETITAPVQAVWSTADMLVPIDQVSRDLVREREPGLFPESFTLDPQEIMTRPEAQRTLLEALPEEAYELFVVPAPEEAPVLHYEQAPDGDFVPMDLPFSTERTWSLVVIDEGPPEPDAGHLRYALAPSQAPFLEWAVSRGLGKEQLTAEKLRRLMMRVQGEEYRPFRVQPEGAAAPADAVTLDFPEAERADVLTGLRAFAEEDERAERLGALYSELPEELRALSPALGATAEAVREALR